MSVYDFALHLLALSNEGLAHKPVTLTGFHRGMVSLDQYVDDTPIDMLSEWVAERGDEEVPDDIVLMHKPCRRTVSIPPPADLRQLVERAVMHACDR